MSRTGSHHACSTHDGSANRNNVPWGACVNSSVGAKANCKIRWERSPFMAKEKEGLNEHHLVGFIETTCNIAAGVAQRQ
jgi:hypothetical protein